MLAQSRWKNESSHVSCSEFTPVLMDLNILYPLAEEKGKETKCNETFLHLLTYLNAYPFLLYLEIASLSTSVTSTAINRVLNTAYKSLNSCKSQGNDRRVAAGINPYASHYRCV
jgi:hypothetical protein